ncbi:Hypothetical_protein [Hexamita inflata]|uniref:Hypothetical_protein n=1 Tax=Hexamita inflata TaxID=28002 RepID=A0AA86Q834_9EUKA|nr:Hypothetical protein HINF_LOCUS41705 [Hexamita inflata]
MLQPQRANCLSSSGRVRLLSQNASRSSQQLILQFKKQDVPKVKPFLPVFGFEPMNNFELLNVQEVVLPLVVRSGRQTVTSRMTQMNKIRTRNESNQTDNKRQQKEVQREVKVDQQHKQHKQEGNEGKQQNNCQRIESEQKKDNKKQEGNNQELKVEELEIDKEQMDTQNGIRTNKEGKSERIRNDHENNENQTQYEEQEDEEYNQDQIKPNKHKLKHTGTNQPENIKQMNKKNNINENLILTTHNEQPTEMTEKVDENENDVDFDKLLSFSHPLKITKTKHKDYAYKETVFDFAKERQSAKYLMGWQRVIRIGGIKIKDWERINGKKMMLLDTQTTQTK